MKEEKIYKEGKRDKKLKRISKKEKKIFCRKNEKIIDKKVRKMYL